MFKYPIAVTIDTNIFDSAKYDLSENSTLQLLKKYVNDGKIKVVLSDIVVRESKKHLAKQANKVCGIARKLRAEVLRESTEHFVNYIGLDRLLEIDKDKSVFIRKSEELFENFIKEIYLNGISDVDFRVHSVDEMSGNLSIVTLLCEAKRLYG